MEANGCKRRSGMLCRVPCRLCTMLKQSPNMPPVSETTHSPDMRITIKWVIVLCYCVKYIFCATFFPRGLAKRRKGIGRPYGEKKQPEMKPTRAAPDQDDASGLGLRGPLGRYLLPNHQGKCGFPLGLDPLGGRVGCGSMVSGALASLQRRPGRFTWIAP